MLFSKLTFCSRLIHSSSNRQLISLLSLVALNFSVSVSLSAVPPFFPNEASKKGITESLIGIFFSIHGLTVMIVAPLLNKIVPHISFKFLLILSIVIQGLCSIIFAHVDKVNDVTLFFAICVVIRMVTAIATAAITVISCSYVMKLYPKNVDIVVGILETSEGMGFTAGPAIGSGLYAIGGYNLPFSVFGMLLLLNVPFCFCSLRFNEDFCAENNNEQQFTNKELTAGKLLPITEVAVTCLALFVSSVSLSFLEPTLEPYLRQFDFSPEMVGFLFFLFYLTHAVCSPLVGYISSKCSQKFLIIICGLLNSSIAFLIISPSAYLPFTLSKYSFAAAMVLLGIANSIAIIPSLPTMLMVTKRQGFGDDATTTNLVSGIWLSIYSSGEVIGAILGGTLLDFLGFPKAATTMSSFCFLVALVVFVTYCTQTKIRRRLRIFRANNFRAII